MSTARKVFIDGPAWVGDMVMAQTLFKLLKQNEPAITIDVLAPAATRPLLERMPEVNRIWTSPFQHGDLSIQRRYQFAKQLKSMEYHWAIVLRNSYKSALIPYWANIPRRTGWLGEWRYGVINDWRQLNKERHPLMIERFMALALEKNATLPNPYPQPALIVTENSVTATLKNLNLTHSHEPLLILCPGAEYGPAKRWPMEYYADVAKVKLKHGWRVWLLGSKKEKDITDQMNQLNEGHCVDLAGRTTLTEAIDLLSLATLVVSNDSGLMHIAAALGRKIVVLYGSSSAKFTPPLTQHAKMLSLNLACSPCFKKECPFGHLNCLKKLSVNEVLTAMDEG
ncbi:MAG: lipopolysaccharide heptosyltransferase II [Coxiella sp. RIFCSPHIGHO2_12_FULL_42_15]|nr:MAG: lipopolysaccharide heptosyltransferase II [Coxiella sp. RIFCSPHIGHO2_12_FULL_42_15]